MAYSEVTVNLFKMKLDKLAQIIQSVEVAERSKYLKAKAAKAATPSNQYRIAKGKPQPLRLKKKTAVDKLEYGKWLKLQLNNAKYADLYTALQRMDLSSTSSPQRPTEKASARP
jgi:hypothetical protein